MADEETRILRPTNGVIQVLAPTPFSFPGSSDAHTVETQLVRYVPTSLWSSGALIVRAHARSLTGTQAFAIVAQNASRCPDEPQTVFSTSTSEAVGSITATVPSAVPGMIVVALGTPISSGLRILLRTTQAAGGGVMTVTLSAELVGREG